MSLLLNDFITVTALEKEEIINNDDEVSCSLLLIDFYKKEQVLTDSKILFLNLHDKFVKKKRLQYLNRFFLTNFKNSRKFSKDVTCVNALFVAVVYTVHISFLKKNTTIHVSDTTGQLVSFCSASLFFKINR